MKDKNQLKSSSTLFGLALKTSKNLFPKVLSPLFFTLALWIAVAAIGFVWPLSLLFTFPLLFAPSSFAFLLSVNALNMGQEATPSSYFLFFMRFFSRDVFGSYRLLRNFFLSLLLSLFLSFLFGLLYVKGASFADASFMESFDAFLEYQKTSNLEALQKLMETDLHLLRFRFYLSVFFLSSFCLIYLHLFLRSGIIPLILRGSGSFPYRVRLAVYSLALRQKGVRYNAHYYGAMLPLYLFIMAFFVLGEYVSSLFLEDVLSQSIVILMGGVSGALLGLLLVLPFYDEVLYGLAGRYEVLFNKTSLLISEEALHQFATMKSEADNQMKMAEKNIERVKKLMEEASKGNEDKSSSSKEEKQSEKNEGSDDEHNS